MVSHPVVHVQAVEITPSRISLKRFPTAMRNQVINLFLDWVRRGPTIPSSVLTAARIAAAGRLQWEHRWQDTAEIAKFTALLRRLDAYTNEALAFAAWVIRRETSLQATHDRYAHGRAIPYPRRRMARQEPTTRQLARLRRLGYGARVQSRLPVSLLIDCMKRGGDHARAER